MHPPIARRQAPLQSETLSNVAARLNAKPMSVALAWLLQRSPNILLIPGTSSVEHLRENVAGCRLEKDRLRNGAGGISDIEGKATRVGASERGQQTSFN
jgi:aryl-alcohol dehydrogenase-like predicted oxidoreductase